MAEIAFPPIDVEEAPPRTAVAVAATATLKQTALASFKPIEAHVRTLAARYEKVAYAVATPAGLKEAKAARLVLREEGRFALQNLRDRLKDEANDLKRVVTDEADRLIAIVKPAEDQVHSQIEAHEARVKAEREERERIERERIRALDERLARLSDWIERCKLPGITADRIDTGMGMLTLSQIGDDWQEYKPRAEARKAEILDVMQELRTQALARERAEIAAQAERERLEAQRLENERVAAELAEQRRQIEAAAAELAAARAESDRLERLADWRREALRQAREAAPNSEGQGSQLVLKAEPATADATDRDAPADASPRGGAMGVGQPAAAGPSEVPYLKLGDLCDLFGGLSLNAGFIADKLGVQFAKKERGATYYTTEQGKAIKAALLALVQRADL